MILDKKLIMKWNPKNREWFISKGYNYTKWHDDFEINVDDLSPTSNCSIKVKCDYCFKEYSKAFYNIVKSRKSDKTGKDSCIDCVQLRKKENKLIKDVVIGEAINEDNFTKYYRIVIDDKLLTIKMCKTCCKYKELSCFRKNTKIKDAEYNHQCTECESVYYEIHSTRIKLNHIKETSRDMGLDVSLTEKQLERMLDRFDEKCVLTDSINYSCEHFIPISWGHGGTNIGNIYLLKHDLNMDKADKNPFRWIDRKFTKFNTTKKKWDKLISYLAKQNKLTVDEFREYVNWCEANKRTKDEVERDGSKTSVDLWRESK